jgi:cysteine sulfinate desulfinase/cysteine desulfurase-like protein
MALLGRDWDRVFTDVSYAKSTQAAGESVRFSLGRFTRDRDVDAAVAAVDEALRKISLTQLHLA